MTKSAQLETQNSDTNVDNSTFSRILSIYTRLGQEIIEAENKHGFQSDDFFKRFVRYYDLLEKSNDGQFKFLTVNTADIWSKIELLNIPTKLKDVESLYVLEYQEAPGTVTKGLILINDFSQEDDNSFNNLHTFHKWFSRLIARDTRTNLSAFPSVYDKDAIVATKIADYFNKHLKHTVIDDKWENFGKDYFIKRCHFFTKRNAKIEAVLPAFPCKSSNLEKVGGISPDKGEELGLRRLISFTEEIEKIYEPGLKVFIVSDGHVFSDCIGVDDDIVDSYTANLKQLYQNIIAENSYHNKECIGFISLKDILYVHNDPLPIEHVKDFPMEHSTGTKIDEASEISRQMLMAGCDTDCGGLRKDINTDNHPRLYLYRGFSRFMSEDLALNSYFDKMSNKKFKKIVSKVSFEMIKRNDAYSNLVELIFPFHLRFSIHAHNNKGPKFGIKLIKSEHCKIIKKLDSAEEPECEDLLHIPTPWHNSIIKIEGADTYYLAKSKIVIDAIEDGHYEGEWVSSDIQTGYGGHFYLKKSSTNLEKQKQTVLN
ncbi:hypothetical protein WICMUC_000832 [Wickerhamomyces mucosus]|uniref:Spore wall maturation protein DIT1 n=1 Tax=Wickerhamomyces mucosus TaxID=1378264 RepID=A0A9P8PXV8_9ASCO|nr:hypothetical protein WICMUC_000832 [Wickerhamomyces mucosus]